MRKPIAVALISTLILASVTLFFYTRQIQVVKDAAWKAAVAEYVYAYTGQSVGRADAVRVRFVNAAVSPEQVGQPVAKGVLTCRPAIEGEAVWEDDRTIRLKPSAPLERGKAYKATVALRKIYNQAPKTLRTFDFDFRVRELSYEVLPEGIQTEPEGSGQQAIGILRTSDEIPAAEVEKMLRATQGNKALTVSWTHSTDGLVHRFRAEGVERSNKGSKVLLQWSGQPLGLSGQGSAEVPVPALDDFTVVSARLEQGDQQYVRLNFSDPLDAAQPLEGLIRLDGRAVKVRFASDGNFVRVYPAERLSGRHTLQVESGIRNAAGKALAASRAFKLNFEELLPQVRMVGRGAIVPQSKDGSVIFPFEAVGLHSVDVEVFKIFNANIPQFLQVNEIEGNQEMERVGQIVLQKKVVLRDVNPASDARSWQRYGLDIKDMIRKDPGAIYQVRIAFRKSYTEYDCSNAVIAQNDDEGAEEEEGNGGPSAPETETKTTPEPDDDDSAHFGRTDEYGNLLSIFGDYRGIYFLEPQRPWPFYVRDGYNWSNREQPCAREYYNSDRFAQRNIFVSDLGLTAKRGRDGSVFAAITDLHTTGSVGGVQLEFYSFQLQSIGKATTENGGTAMVENLREVPFLMVATQGARRGYLRMADGMSLSLSRFDVAGIEAQKGLKGYLYGERGVWRPGDSLYLNFVLEDKTGNLPANHPLQFELTDPRGSLQYRTVVTQNTGGVYALPCATRADAPTGNWTAKVQVGGATFLKSLKIETVKPNRLKLDLDFGRKALSVADQNLTGQLKVNWLTGATAKGLKTKVEAQVRAVKTIFPNHKDFTFDDPARSFYSDPQVLFEGNLNDLGQASIPLSLKTDKAAPGKLIANFKVRAFEGGGDFSTDNFSLDYFPYNSFVGVSIPTNRWGAKELPYDGGNVQFAMVDKDGKPLANRSIEVGLYQCDWRWWWDEDRADNVAQFNAAEHVEALERAKLTTNAQGIATWKVKPTGWGRYLVRVSDLAGGHCAGDFFWSGYPDDRDDLQSRNAAAMLAFAADKEQYNLGEEVTLRVPASENGRILLTLENGARVVQHLWFDAKAGDNLLKFKTTEQMAPTVYAHVSLLQPHAQTKNDLPIRMYGVIPINVENAATRLQPQITMPDVLKPGEAFSVSLKETGGKACAYTLAIVDEGLLDLTRFKTPNPWETFYAREALGIKTWDMFDYVLGAYGAELERILSVGGDGINQKARNAAQINRFKPAVKHLGPFYLAKGQTATHRLTIDNYVGSVRVMAVLSAPASAGKGAYGMAEKTCPVRKDLMVLPTLPRVLGPGETLRLPVEVFAAGNVKNATIRLKETSGLATVTGAAANTLQFDKPDNKLTSFDIKVGNKTGAAKFVIQAEGGGESATETIDIVVRNPNPTVSNVWEGVIEPGKEWTANYDPAQFTDIGNAAIEVSPLPGINLTRHLQYLIQYPYGCVEQTTSTAFPQLFVDILSPLSTAQKAQISKNMTAAIQRLRSFQTPGGGFAYWPGQSSVDDWSSSYAGHFLVEAKNKGYALPGELLERWINYQTRSSRQWTATATTDNYGFYHGTLTQAYRLYTLALAGRADMAGMNRLRETKGLYIQSAHLLAAAYASAGKPEVARQMIGSAWREDWRYDWSGSTYGSDLRDRALILETLATTGDLNKAQAALNFVCENLGKEQGFYWSTQSIATALRALSRYVSKSAGSGPVYSWRAGNKAYQNGDGTKMISTANFTETAAVTNGISIKNGDKVRLYARLIVSGQKITGAETAENSNIALSVRYTDLKGAPIDVTKIKQGTDFAAEVTVRRTSTTMLFPFNELALTQIFPSGWEIMNARMSGVSGVTNSPMDYQDVRDDRVYTYFDLPGSKDTRVYRIQLNAAYTGRYYLSGINCEGMYDNRVRSRVAGQWVEVL